MAKRPGEPFPETERPPKLPRTDAHEPLTPLFTVPFGIIPPFNLPLHFRPPPPISAIPANLSAPNATDPCSHLCHDTFSTVLSYLSPADNTVASRVST